ncbi:Sugar transporter [Popillia japonica]|uniref:Sugar transporter n=1 Tax=Popillia japonica TaxID=7064 RepID=A0AAW1L3I5_POPJA
MFLNLENTRYMQYAAAIAATLSNAAATAYVVWPSPVLSLLQSEDSPLGTPITEEEGSWVVALVRFASIPTAFLAGWMVEKIGRKKSLLISGVLMFFLWFMIIFAKSIWVIYVARFLAGIGSGIVSVGCAIYAAEIAEKDIRGKLTSTFAILKLAGSLLVLCVGPYASYNVLAIVCSSLPLLFVCTYAFMPESPYYLVKVKRNEEAERNLRILSSKSADDKFIERSLMEIEQSIEEDMKNKTTIWEFLSNKDYRAAILIMLGLKTLQQLSGESAIDGYMQPIIEATGSNISPELSSIIFGLVQIPGVLLASYLVDTLGRRPLLVISSTGCAAALFAEGTYFYLQNKIEADVSGIGWLPTVSLAIFVFMLNLGIITLPYVLAGELFPANIKGIASAAISLYSAILAFLVSKFFKPVSITWGEHTVFWIFGAVCVLGVIFSLTMLPETKGKSFAEIQAILKKSPKDCVVEKKDVDTKV